MKIIKDPVHGYVEVEDFALALLDSMALQRLRYIRQLGFSYLVYPGANHTRFEHSLGTMFLADVAARRFGLSDKDSTLVVAAGLPEFVEALRAHAEDELLPAPAAQRRAFRIHLEHAREAGAQEQGEGLAEVLVALDVDDLAGLDLSDEGGAEVVEGAGLWVE